MTKKITIPEMKNWKLAGKKIVMVTAYDYSSARLISKTDIEIILVGDSLGMTMLGYDSTVPVTMAEMIHHTKPVVKGAADCFVVTDMPFGSYNINTCEAIRNAVRFLKEAGADAVKLEGGEAVAETVRAIVQAGIPVMGHIGLTPQTISQMGGYHVQGRDASSGKRLLAEAKILQDAGAFAIVLECVPVAIAKLITAQLEISTFGIGAGADCDGQVLVYQDLLGMYDRMVPKFVKRYAHLGEEITSALADYSAEVRSGLFPAEEHGFTIPAAALAEILDNR